MQYFSPIGLILFKCIFFLKKTLITVQFLLERNYYVKLHQICDGTEKNM